MFELLGYHLDQYVAYQQLDMLHHDEIEDCKRALGCQIVLQTTKQHRRWVCSCFD